MRAFYSLIAVLIALLTKLNGKFLRVRLFVEASRDNDRTPRLGRSGRISACTHLVQSISHRSSACAGFSVEASPSGSSSSNVAESSSEQLQGVLRELQEQEQRYRSAYLRATNEANMQADQLDLIKKRVVEAQLERQEAECVKHIVVVNGKLHVVCKPTFHQSDPERRVQKLLVPI
jgi:hypothetical protein